MIIHQTANLTVLSLCASSSLFILSGSVSGMLVLLSLVIQGCFNASIAVYLCAMLNRVSFMKRFLARSEKWGGHVNYVSFDNFY